MAALVGELDGPHLLLPTGPFLSPNGIHQAGL